VIFVTKLSHKLALGQVGIPGDTDSHLRIGEITKTFPGVSILTYIVSNKAKSSVTTCFRD